MVKEGKGGNEREGGLDGIILTKGCCSDRGKHSPTQCDVVRLLRYSLGSN